MRRVLVLGLVVCAGAAFATAIEGQASRSVWDGVYTAEQAKRGEVVYAQYCASCHGSSLLGAEAAPALTGFEFNSNWDGLSVGELFERIRMSMPAEDPGKVSAQQKADIVAHMLRVGGFPAGSAELPRDVQRLQQIRYVSTKP
jgi:quinoprotein glucose dehydrogenase